MDQCLGEPGSDYFFLSQNATAFDVEHWTWLRQNSLHHSSTTLVKSTVSNLNCKSYIIYESLNNPNQQCVSSHPSSLSFHPERIPSQNSS